MAQHDVKKPHLRQYYRNQQGSDYITYPGLLAEFHAQNDAWMAEHPSEHDRRGIRSKLIQIPSPENGNTAIAQATVTMSSGAEYSDIGDANDSNLNKMMATARCRMASTRAKGRSLRDATNIGTTMYEELPDAESSDLDEHDTRPQDAPKPAPTATREPAPAQRPQTNQSTAPEHVPAPGERMATEGQLRAISNLYSQLGKTDRVPADLTDQQARGFIQSLSNEITERKAQRGNSR